MLVIFSFSLSLYSFTPSLHALRLINCVVFGFLIFKNFSSGRSLNLQFNPSPLRFGGYSKMLCLNLV